DDDDVRVVLGRSLFALEFTLAGDDRRFRDAPIDLAHDVIVTENGPSPKSEGYFQSPTRAPSDCNVRRDTTSQPFCAERSTELSPPLSAIRKRVSRGIVLR